MITEKLKELEQTDLGSNIYKLYEKASKINNGNFVDLGVRTGVSSEIFLLTSNQNNIVNGVDVDWSLIKPNIITNPNYKQFLGDSVTVGKNLNISVNGLFVDTFHIKEQVMCELYYWYDKVIEEGFIAFHDSHWPEGKYDEYGGIKWERVEEGIKDFFNLSDLNYEDKFIKSEHFPDSWGMTIITIKKKKDYISLYKKWEEIFDRRNYLISLFWNEDNKSDVEIELKLTPYV
jgi:hypothetical protein